MDMCVYTCVFCKTHLCLNLCDYSFNPYNYHRQINTQASPRIFLLAKGTCMLVQLLNIHSHPLCGYHLSP